MDAGERASGEMSGKLGPRRSLRPLGADPDAAASGVPGESYF